MKSFLTLVLSCTTFCALSQWNLGTPSTSIYYNGGNVGIGTSSPLGFLHVNPSRPVIIKNNGGGAVYGSEIGFNAILDTYSTPTKFKKLGGTGQAGGASLVVDYYGNMYFQMYYANTENESIVEYAPQVSFLNSGNVGIGTQNPDAKLAVKGTIHAEEIKVDLNVPGPDYVFEKDYNLPALSEVENYILQNKHLPEVPSAKEMELNGVNLSEMNMLLLKKVEELTLYIIELKKSNDLLQADVQALKTN